ncbi:MAG TPA: ion transporter [Vitreimonas sp.]|uniref:ion transporter n=1 Tax=Vitreimonas sp. TaxID=3069702 RepID=UPI002D394DCE|nr:ion transporter [Vitreimonas sp.]HYD88206.1 ion transporter [Vitreimonas sp.]
MPLIKRKHATAKAYVHDWLEPDQPGGINFFSGTIIALVIVSLFSLAMETELLRVDSGLDRAWLPLVQWINVAVVWIFALEFALRFWSEGENPRHAGVIGRLRFLAQPVTIGDVLAFAPELIAMLFFPSYTGMLFPAMRALRLFRLFKLARYVPAFAIVGAAVRRAWAPLMAALAVAAAQLYIAAMMLYFIEGATKPQAFGSIARAMWWAVVTLTTVGYGDVYPETLWGRVAAGLVALAGVGIVALPTGILASAFAEEFRERHEASQRALNDAQQEAAE